MNDDTSRDEPAEQEQQDDPFDALNQVKAQGEVSFAGDTFDDFVEALAMLHIPGNLSGRLHFAKNWPAPAAFLFGETLITMDREGAPDKEARAKLEDEAVMRQHELQSLAASYLKKSIDGGSLQLEFVEPLIKQLGRDMALIFYRADIVDRILPPPAPSATPEPEQPEAPQMDTQADPAPEPEPEPELEPDMDKDVPQKSTPLGLRITGDKRDD